MTLIIEIYSPTDILGFFASPRVFQDYVLLAVFGAFNLIYSLKNSTMNREGLLEAPPSQIARTSCQDVECCR